MTFWIDIAPPPVLCQFKMSCVTLGYAFCQFPQICLSCLFLVQLGSFKLLMGRYVVANHQENIWHCLALLSWLNIVSPSVFIQFAWFNLQMKSLSEEIFINIWHCLFIDQKDQKDQKDYIKASFCSTEFI